MMQNYTVLGDALQSTHLANFPFLFGEAVALEDAPLHTVSFNTCFIFHRKQHKHSESDSDITWFCKSIN